MNKEIKLNRGWTLTKDSSTFMACDTNLDIFIHADGVQLGTDNGKRGKTWLNLKADGKQVASIWLTTKASIKRVKDLLKEE